MTLKNTAGFVWDYTRFFAKEGYWLARPVAKFLYNTVPEQVTRGLYLASGRNSYVQQTQVWARSHFVKIPAILLAAYLLCMHTDCGASCRNYFSGSGKAKVAEMQRHSDAESIEAFMKRQDKIFALQQKEENVQAMLLGKLADRMENLEERIDRQDR